MQTAMCTGLKLTRGCPKPQGMQPSEMNAAREGERVGPTKSGEKGTGERRGFGRMVRKGIEEGIPRVSSGSCRVEGANLYKTAKSCEGKSGWGWWRKAGGCRKGLAR